MDASGDAAHVDGALVLDRVSVPFGTGAGLADISFSVARGQRLAIVGPSGVGKTTLLRAIAGLSPATTGQIAVDGRDVTALRPEQRDVVYLHQTPVLFEHLTVGENVAFPLRIRRVADGDIHARVASALAAVRLEGLERRAPHALSGGQRHRVALARAIAARPAVLLLDEPLSALDPSLRDEVRAAIVAAQVESGAAIVFVTHDFDDAGILADEVAVLLGGTIAQRGTPETLFAHPASLVVAQLLGVYQTLPGRVRSGGAVECAFGMVPADATLPEGSHAIVAFRSVALHVVTSADDACGVSATVLAVRHRAHGASLELRLGSSPNGPTVEVPSEPFVSASPGRTVRVVLDPRGVRVFPA